MRRRRKRGALATPAFAAAYYGATVGAGTCTVNYTATTGQLLVMLISFENATTATPSGWTLIGTTFGGSHKAGLYWRICAGETSASVTTAALGAMFVMAYNGGSSVGANGGTIASTSPVNPGTLSTTGTNSIVACLALNYNSTTAPALPSGFTSHVSTSDATVGGRRASDLSTPTAGTSVPLSFTFAGATGLDVVGGGVEIIP